MLVVYKWLEIHSNYTLECLHHNKTYIRSKQMTSKSRLVECNARLCVNNGSPLTGHLI
jgi:hypothetical protein